MYPIPYLNLLFIYYFPYSTTLFFIIIFFVFYYFLRYRFYTYYVFALSRDLWDCTYLPTSRNKEIYYFDIIKG